MRRIKTYLILLFAAILFVGCHSRDLYDPDFGKTDNGDNGDKREANTFDFWLSRFIVTSADGFSWVIWAITCSMPQISILRHVALA